MKALLILQPWASLIAVGAKKIETRPWNTNYRGPIAIHASKKFERDQQMLAGSPLFFRALQAYYGNEIELLPTGVILATAELVDCKFMGVASPQQWVKDLPENELAFGYYATGRYGWFFDNVKLLERPVPMLGARSLWEFDSSCISN